MKKIIAILCTLLLVCSTTYGAKVNVKSVKEYKVENGKKVLDRTAKYDAKGNKVEETEYNKEGKMKEYTTFSYNAAGKCIEEKHYDASKKLEKTVKIEYNEFGKKKSEKNYLSNGKLKSEHTFEYVTE